MPCTQLVVKVERVLYPKPDAEGSWYILQTDAGIAKGDIGWRPAPAERLVLEGDYASWKGRREFKFSTAMPDVPIDMRDQLHYACERTPGFGAALEISIWDRYGEAWRDIEPDTVPKVGNKLWQRLMLTIQQIDAEVEKSRAIVYLLGKGCTMGMSCAAWDAWEKDTVGKVNSDCYVLADLPHYGFCHVDTSVRHRYEIGDDDPRRLRAVVKYAMKQETSRGSTVVAWTVLLQAAQKHSGGIDGNLVAECVRQMFAEGTLHGFPGSQTIALATDYANELAIWKYVNESR